jgi:hypothetical protein
LQIQAAWEWLWAWLSQVIDMCHIYQSLCVFNMCHIYQRKIHANAQYVCNRLWVFFAPNISFMYVNDSLLVHIFSDWVPLLHIVENGRKLFFVAFHLSFQKHEVLL